MIHTSDSAKCNNLIPKTASGELLTISSLRIGPPDRMLAPATPSPQSVITLLNTSLANELVCVLRYKRNQFMAAALGLDDMTEQYLLHSTEEMTHAELLAQRIVELGGRPDFSPESLTHNGHASYDDAHDLVSMTRSHLVAEHAAIETYAQIIDVLSGTDPVTQKLIEGIVLEELEHASSINDWFGQVSMGSSAGRFHRPQGPASLQHASPAARRWESDRQ